MQLQQIDLSTFRGSGVSNLSPLPPQPRRRRDFQLVFVAVAALVLLGLFVVRIGQRPIPTPGPPVDGLHVLVVFPDGMTGLSKDQAEFANSAKVADRVEELGGKYRRYPASQNLDNEDPVWREMRGQLSPPYGLGVLNNRRLTKSEIPQGIEAGLRVIEGAR